MSGPRMTLTGNLPPRWNAAQLRRHCRVINGGTPTTDEENWNGDIPFITPPDIRAHLGRPIDSTLRTLTEQGARSGSAVAKHGVIVSNRAPIGYVARLNGTSAFNQGCKVLLSRTFDERFLTFVMLSAAPSLEVLGQGTTFMEISSASLGSVSIPVPPLIEQHAIADYLDRETAKIDTLIEEQTAMIERLRERRLAVIDRAVLPGASPDIPLYLVTLGIKDGTHGTFERVDESSGRPLLSAKDIQQNRLTEHVNATFVSPEDHHNIVSNGFPQYGDVLLVIIGATIGKTAIYERRYRTSFQRSVAFIRPRSSLLARYLHYQIQGRRFQDNLLLRAKTSAQPGVYLGDLSRILIRVPPLDEQREIADYLDRETAKVDTLIAKVERHIELAKERRAALITAAVTGQIDVMKDAA